MAMKKPWTPPKRPGEMADTAQIRKKGKVRVEDIKIKAEVKQNEQTHN